MYLYSLPMTTEFLVKSIDAGRVFNALIYAFAISGLVLEKLITVRNFENSDLDVDF